MKRIPLTQGQFAIVDDEDYERLSKFKWRAERHGDTKTFYAVRSTRRGADGKRGFVYMHREVMNAQPGECVDHINHNTLDQQKSNLRLCTVSQNNANQKIQVRNKSGFRGVSWDTRRGKWVAQISVNGKRKNLGRYSAAIDAARAYDTAAIAANCEFAMTNAKLGLLP